MDGDDVPSYVDAVFARDILRSMQDDVSNERNPTLAWYIRHTVSRWMEIAKRFMGNTGYYVWLSFQIHRLTYRGIVTRRGMGITGAEYWLTWMMEIFCKRFGPNTTKEMLNVEKMALQRLMLTVAQQTGQQVDVPMAQLAPAFFGEDFCVFCGGRGYHQTTCRYYAGPDVVEFVRGGSYSQVQERPRRHGYAFACVTCGQYDVQWLHEDDTQCINCARREYEAGHPDPPECIV